jgi:serine/threonine protein kinase
MLMYQNHEDHGIDHRDLKPENILAVNQQSGIKIKHMITDLHLLCPLDSILAGVVANLALEVTQEFVIHAINDGLQ